VRRLTPQERDLLPAMLRAGALRFWLSRLWDLHLPREASMLKAHDPSHFERVLRQRIEHPLSMASIALEPSVTSQDTAPELQSA
jgi:homoserine kinase type II